MLDRRETHKSQNANAQIRIEKGAATTRPFAKLRVPAEAGAPTSNSSNGSFMTFVLSEIAQKIIPSGEGRRNHVLSGAAQTGASAGQKVKDRQHMRHSRGMVLGDFSTACETSPIARPCYLENPIAGPAASSTIRTGPSPRQRRMKWPEHCAALFVACTALSQPAAAQDADVITPIDLFDPESGTGLQVGSQFLLLPRLDADTTYDTNIYNVDQGKIDDAIVSIRPRLLLKSDFARHYMALRGGADFRLHADTTAEDSEQYDASWLGQLDLGSRISLRGEAGYLRGIERRGTAGDQFLSDSPIEFDRKSASLRLQRTGGALEILTEARIAEKDYNDTSQNGVAVDLSGRDVTIRAARARASSRLNSRTRMFVEAAGNQIRYERVGATPRDSDGFAALGGVQLQISSLVDLEAAVGYIHQNFDDPMVKSVNGINYRLQVDWTPKPDWQLTARVGRFIDPSPRDEVPAIVRSDFSLEARHAVSDRLLLSAEGGFLEENYSGSLRKDQRYYARLGAHYRLADPIGLIASAGFRKQDGGMGSRDYEGFAISIGVRVKL